MPKRKAIVMLWSQDLRSCDQTAWLSLKRINLILSDLSLLLDLSLLSICYPYSKTPLSSTCYLCNGLVTVTLVIIELPSIWTLLSSFEKEVLFVIELIKQNVCAIEFIKRLLANQCLIWSSGKARRVNSSLVIPLRMPLLRSERMISWMQLDLLLECQYHLLHFDSLPQRQSLIVVKWVIHIAAYNYKCEKGEKDLNLVAKYLMVHDLR